MRLPSRKTQLPAHAFRSQYRLRWNFTLPDQDRSYQLKMDGAILWPDFVVLKNLAQRAAD